MNPIEKIIAVSAETGDFEATLITMDNDELCIVFPWKAEATAFAGTIDDLEELAERTQAVIEVLKIERGL